MIIGGTSIKGSYHNKNQDSFFAQKYKNKYIVVVSDGLGSKKYSKKGSSALCKSVVKYLNEDYNLLNNEKKIFSSIHEIWINMVKEYGVENCYATALIAIFDDNNILLYRLGDGAIVLNTDKDKYVLRDKKEEFFINQTDCMSNKIDYSKLEILKLENEKIESIIMFSDGLCIGPDEDDAYIGFLDEFTNEYKLMSKNDVNLDIKKWLKGWPSTDDKTIAYYIS